MRKSFLICLAWIIYIVPVFIFPCSESRGGPGMDCNYHISDICYELHGNYKQALVPYLITTSDNGTSCRSLCDMATQCYSYSENNSHCFLSQCDSYEKNMCSNCWFARKINLTGAVSCSSSSELTTTSAMTGPSVYSTIKTEDSAEESTEESTETPRITNLTLAANNKTLMSHQTVTQLENSVNVTEAYNTSATSSPSDRTTAQQESNRSLTTDFTASVVTTPSSVSLTVSEVNTPLPVESNATKPSNNETVPFSNTLGITEVNGTTTWTQTFDTSLTMNENVSDPTITLPINACVCVCKFTNQSVEDSIKIRKKELAVDKRSLTTTVRKLNSARDVRKSSKGIGALSVIVLITCGALVIFPDVFTCLNFLYKSILKNKKKKKRQVRNFHV